MEIEQKLILSEQPVTFFAEGPFLKVYNQSFYVVSELLNFRLKPFVKHIKKINQVIVYSGFPAHIINKRFPQAIPTQQGYELIRNYDLCDYQTWFNQLCEQHHYNQLITIEPPTANQKQVNIEHIIAENVNKSLTKQQLLFLMSWQADKYPQAIDRAFIQELKDYFCFR